MKQPSNLVISFVVAIATVFCIYALGRIALRVLQAPLAEEIREK